MIDNRRRGRRIALRRAAHAGALMVGAFLLPGVALAHHDQHRDWGLPFAVADGLHGTEAPAAAAGAGADRPAAIYTFDASLRGLSALQPAEIRLIEAALAGLPPALVAGLAGRPRAVRYDPRPERFVRGGPAEGVVVGISGPGRIGIRLGPGWRAMNPAAQRATVIHEVAHDFARKLAKQGDWVTNWRRAVRQDDRLASMRGRETAYVSRYAATGVEEDLAESIVAYLYTPKLLRERAPHRRHVLTAMLAAAGPKVG